MVGGEPQQMGTPVTSGSRCYMVLLGCEARWFCIGPTDYYGSGDVLEH